jgi:nardilysin
LRFILQKQGGHDNAATDWDVTTFYFVSQERHLRKALDKFAQFFISPLMKKDAMQREREAIESGN